LPALDLLLLLLLDVFQRGLDQPFPRLLECHWSPLGPLGTLGKGRKGIGVAPAEFGEVNNDLVGVVFFEV